MLLIHDSNDIFKSRHLPGCEFQQCDFQTIGPWRRKQLVGVDDASSLTHVLIVEIDLENLSEAHHLISLLVQQQADDPELRF